LQGKIHVGTVFDRGYILWINLDRLGELDYCLIVLPLICRLNPRREVRRSFVCFFCFLLGPASRREQ
jgi:hypothetical protein